MTRITTNALQEGMVLAADVRNADDMLLLPAGCSLTARHLGILQAWGVTEVDVQLEAGAALPDDPVARMEPAELARLTAELKQLFWEFDEANPVAMEIFNLVLRREVVRRKASGGS
jgi:hypothetical protein